MATDDRKTLRLSEAQKRQIKENAHANIREVHPLLKRAKDSEEMLPYWEKSETIVEGYDAVRMAGTDFLPRFGEEGDADYQVRLEMSKYTNIYRDVLEGLASKPFQEEVTLIGSEEEDIPLDIVEFIEDVDGAGNNLTVFSAQTFFDGINSAIDWIFVDYPTMEEQGPVTVAQAREQNIKPFWTRVLGRNILEVQTMMVGAKEEISYIRVFEPSNNDDPDHVRVFMRMGNTVNWELYRKNEEAEKVEDQMVLVGQGTLSISYIPFVPFITGRRYGRSFKIAPPMRDAIDLQVTLYQEESALQFIKTMAGYPMLAGNGVKPERDEDGEIKKLAVGPMKVLYSQPNNNGQHGQWKYIEPSANSMEFLKKSIDTTKQDLRELGRQPLTALSSQLTTVTTSIAAGKAKSAVGAWALLLVDALENALKITAEYMNVVYDPKVNVYTDFDNVSDTNADVDNLLSARERGDLSQDTLWEEMQRRKILSPEFDAEKERAKIADEIPVDVNDSPEINEDPPEGDE